MTDDTSYSRRNGLTANQVLRKIRHYCAYQERSHAEVRNKLYGWGLTSDEVNRVMVDLISEGFLNEERFARSYAGGKFRMKKWGRLKIIRELEAREISPYCIKAALQEIDESDYRQTLLELLLKKKETLTPANPLLLRNRIAKYLIARGYEPDLVWEVLKQQIPG
jgi:regulatory protein